MKYLNQLEYEHIPYHTNVCKEGYTEAQRLRNVRLSGCGPCSTCMVVDLLTDKTLEIEECIRISEECVANHSNGTDMKVLSPVIAEKFGLDYYGTSDLSEAIACLQKGGAIVCHVGIPEGKEIGLFTNGGHYMALISTDGKEFCILDPSYTPEKYHIPEREGRVNDKNAPYLYCDVNVVDSETKPNRVKYHTFMRKKA